MYLPQHIIIMNTLLLEYLDKILNEVGTTAGVSREAQLPGSILLTPEGNYRAKRTRDGKVLYWGDERVARAWVTSEVDDTGGTDADAEVADPSDGIKTARFISQTTRPGKTTAGNVDAVRRERPNAESVRVIDTLTDEEVTNLMDQLNIPTGEDVSLPSEMRPRRNGYEKKDLDGHYGNEQYYDRMRDTGYIVRDPLFEMPKNVAKMLQSRGFPMQYIKLIERAMNVQATGDEPKFSDMISGVGAGQNASQFGEIMSMTMVTIPSENRSEFAALMKQQIEESKMSFLQQKLGVKEFNKLRADTRSLARALKTVFPVAGGDWVDAAVGHADAFDSYANEMYGEGQWKLEGSAWDRRVDIEDLGLDYENKGFSTDALFRIQPITDQGDPDGPAQVVRASLKKDEKVMLFNGGVGEIKNLVRTSYGSLLHRKIYNALGQILSLLDVKKSKLEREGALTAVKKLLKIDGSLSYDQAKKLINQQMAEIDSTARQLAPPVVRKVLDRVESFTTDQKNSALAVAQLVAADNNIPTSGRELKNAIASAAEVHKSKGWKENDLTRAYTIVKKCANASDFEVCVADKIGSNAADRIAKICTLATAVAEQFDVEYEQHLIDHLAIAKDLGREYISLFDRDRPEMVASLMGVLKEKFPMAVVMGGGEMMIINGTHVGTRTLQTLFGVESYDDLRLGLKLINVDGEIILAYEGSGKDAKPVVIGTVDCRQKGSGYASLGFEIKCSDEFVLRAARANEENGTTSESNTGAIQRIANRMTGRVARATTPPIVEKQIKKGTK